MKYAIALVLFIVSFTPTWAMDFSIIGFKVQAKGAIRTGDSKRFKNFSKSNDIRGMEIFLDSPGGLTIEALGIGRAIRKLGMRT